MLDSFNYSILEFYHSLAEAAGGFFTPLAKVISFIGENGILFFAIAFALALFPKTRKIGVCVFGAVCCGTLITTFILKDAIEVIRPCNTEMYKDWWRMAGAVIEEGYSFPSGHATAAAAGVTALALIWDKKVLWAGVPYVIIMCASRNYLMAHYPTDVIAGVCVGIFSAVVAYLITLGIFAFLEKYKENKICNFLLTGVDAGSLFKGKDNGK